MSTFETRPESITPPNNEHLVESAPAQDAIEFLNETKSESAIDWRREHLDQAIIDATDIVLEAKKQ